MGEGCDGWNDDEDDVKYGMYFGLLVGNCPKYDTSFFWIYSASERDTKFIIFEIYTRYISPCSAA